MNCLEKEKINNNKEKYYFEIFFFPSTIRIICQNSR